MESEGGDVTDEIIEGVENSVRAVENYREDFEEEYRLWRAAVINSGRAEAAAKRQAQTDTQ